MSSLISLVATLVCRYIKLSVLTKTHHDNCMIKNPMQNGSIHCIQTTSRYLINFFVGYFSQDFVFTMLLLYFPFNVDVLIPSASLSDECTSPPPIKGLSTSTTFPILFGTKVTVTCDVMYKLQGDNTITCVNDREFSYNNLQPSCLSSKQFTQLLKQWVNSSVGTK